MKYKKKKCIEQKLGDSVILYSIDNEKFIELNETSSLIWTNIEEKSIDEIIDIILEQYDVEKEIVHRDVEKIVKEFLEKEIIGIVNERDV